MSKSNGKRMRQRCLGPFLVWVAVLALCLSTGGHKAVSAKGNADPAQRAKARAREAALKAAMNAATMGFAPSLEMKENTDFLLTPALLVQEVLSDDLIVTYPSE